MSSKNIGMRRHTPRALLALACLAYPGILMAEVSDKEPIAVLFWQVGIAAALLCLFTARFKPWLGAICFVPATSWFASLFLELRSPDISLYLRLEQGNGYYLQACTRRLRTGRRTSLAQTQVFLTRGVMNPSGKKKRPSSQTTYAITRGRYAAQPKHV